MKTLTTLLISFLLSANAVAAPTQECFRVDEADDWVLTFDFSNEEVSFFDNDSYSFGEFTYTVEIVGGIDVFESTDINDPWTAKFYGDRNSNGNKAELLLDAMTIEFVCRAQESIGS